VNERTLRLMSMRAESALGAKNALRLVRRTTFLRAAA
jgi:hypothetical protein